MDIGKNTDTPGGSVIDLLVIGNQLCVNVLDGVGDIDGGSVDPLELFLIVIKGSEMSS